MYRRNAQGWLKHIDFIALDVIVLQVSYILGYMIRHGWGEWAYRRQEYISLAVILSIVDILSAVLFNTMHNVLKRDAVREASATLKHTSLVLVIMSLYIFSAQTGDIYSRITIYLTSALHLVLGYGARMLWKKVIRRLSRGKSKATMILVAAEGRIPEILRQVSSMDSFEYAGLVITDRDAAGETLEGIPVVASLQDAADYICREWVDEILVYPEQLDDLKTVEGEGGTEAAGAEGQSDLARLIRQCREMAVPVHIRLPFDGAGGKNFIEKVGGCSVLTVSVNYASPWQMALKRLIDILGGLIGSLAALAVIAVVGPKIKRESPGPVLFRQTRIGLNGKHFRCYKIRSMYMDAEERKKELLEQNRVADGRMFKLDWDPRVIGNRMENGEMKTGIGEKIRSSSLDEFPQFFNVLKGDMSLVGTRPPTVDEWEKYKYHHRARLAVKPGITGMWQISGRSKITDFEEVVRLDTEYINNWSIGLDIRILLKTIRAVIRKDGAM